MSRQRYCFVAMPFRPELNYFFLYLKQYLEEKYGMHIERGDDRILTKPLMEKIREQILRADLVIGDVTGNNANVFYELGLAHAGGKPILFLTQHEPEETPVDIRQFEFIQYDLGKHKELLIKLDNAISNAFSDKYEGLFDKARTYLRRFNNDTGLSCQQNELEDFQSLVMRGEQTGGIPSEDREYMLAQFLLPKIILDFTDAAVIRKYTEWLSSLPD